MVLEQLVLLMQLLLGLVQLLLKTVTLLLAEGQLTFLLIYFVQKGFYSFLEHEELTGGSFLVAKPCSQPFRLIMLQTEIMLQFPMITFLGILELEGGIIDDGKHIAAILIASFAEFRKRPSTRNQLT